MVAAGVRGRRPNLGNRWHRIADNPLAIPAPPKRQAVRRLMNIRNCRYDIVFAQVRVYYYL